MAPKASSKAKLIFSPQKRQRKTVVPSADKLEVFIIRYSEKAQLVSEAFDEDQACFQIDVTHGGKPSMLYRLKDHFLNFCDPSPLKICRRRRMTWQLVE